MSRTIFVESSREEKNLYGFLVGIPEEKEVRRLKFPKIYGQIGHYGAITELGFLKIRK